MNVRFREVPHQAVAGHKPPLTCVVARAFKRRLHPVTGHPIAEDERSVIGHS